MRARDGLTVFTLALSSLGLLAVITEACGGKSSTSPPADSGVVKDGSPDTAPVVDSGPDVKDASAPDTASADTTPPTPPCPVEASLANLSLPDASLPHDASVSGCLVCASMSCGMQVAACDEDCMCKEALESVLMCATGKGASVKTCALQALGETNALALGSCMVSSCEVACGIEGFSLTDAGMDAPAVAEGGEGEAGEASATDAPAESASDGAAE